jgi:hypothetical protein
MPSTEPERADAENVRQVIAAQTSIGASVQALLRAVSAMIGNALNKGDPSALQAFADHIDANPKAWSDAVQANTSLAAYTVEPLQNVPPYVADKFALHASRLNSQREEQARNERMGAEGAEGERDQGQGERDEDEDWRAHEMPHDPNQPEPRAEA